MMRLKWVPKLLQLVVDLILMVILQIQVFVVLTDPADASDLTDLTDALDPEPCSTSECVPDSNLGSSPLLLSNLLRFVVLI
jgi:hypothetical protein